MDDELDTLLGMIALDSISVSESDLDSTAHTSDPDNLSSDSSLISQGDAESKFLEYVEIYFGDARCEDQLRFAIAYAIKSNLQSLNSETLAGAIEKILNIYDDYKDTHSLLQYSLELLTEKNIKLSSEGFDNLKHILDSDSLFLSLENKYSIVCYAVMNLEESREIFRFEYLLSTSLNLLGVTDSNFIDSLVNKIIDLSEADELARCIDILREISEESEIEVVREVSEKQILKLDIEHRSLVHLDSLSDTLDIDSIKTLLGMLLELEHHYLKGKYASILVENLLENYFKIFEHELVAILSNITDSDIAPSDNLIKAFINLLNKIEFDESFFYAIINFLDLSSYASISAMDYFISVIKNHSDEALINHSIESIIYLFKRGISLTPENLSIIEELPYKTDLINKTILSLKNQIEIEEKKFSEDYRDVRSVEELLDLIELKNPGIDVIKLKNKFDIFLKSFSGYSALFRSEEIIISYWDESIILKWSALVKENSLCKYEKFIPEALAVINRGCELFYGYKLRDTQILSLLIFSDFSEGRGILGQISTGEGKTTVTAALAILNCFRGEKVDVITSSKILAKRDLDENAGLFKMFGITSSCNDTKVPGAKICYLSDIVYGSVDNFQYDLLNDEFYDKGTKCDRRFGVAIVDEVDSMIVDEKSKVAMISSPISAAEHLVKLYTLIWNEILRLASNISYDADQKCWYYSHKEVIDIPEELKSKETFTDEELKELRSEAKVEETIIPLISKTHFIFSSLKAFIQDSLSRIDIKIPTHLVEFADSQVDKWVFSAIDAYNKEEGRDYVISKDDMGKKSIIAPINHSSTGYINIGMNWSNGLHQFLQIKHSLKISYESLLSTYISNCAYFKKYGSKIYGMTGTLGSQYSQELIKHIYDLDLFFCPTFKEKQFIEKDSIIETGRDAWKESITRNIIEETAQKRAVLVICASINDAKAINDSLISQGVSEAKIRMYTRSDNNEKTAIEDKVSPGDIIVATNLAGRGTDIKISDVVEFNGGLHVIVTFLPKNLRVEEQAFGRAARQGEPGSGMLILNDYDLPPEYYIDSYEGSTIEHLRYSRDMAEEASIKQVIDFELEMLLMRDELFLEFSKFRKTLIGDRELGGLVKVKINQVQELWGLFLKNLEKDDESSKCLLEYKLKKSGFDFGYYNNGMDSIFFALYQEMKYLSGGDLPDEITQETIKRAVLKYIYDNPEEFSNLESQLSSFMKKVEAKKFLSDHKKQPNAYNNQDSIGYWYDSVDIGTILPELVDGYENVYLYRSLSEDSFKRYLDDILDLADRGNIVALLYNKGGNHWTSIVVLKLDDRYVVLYKDSFGSGNAYLESIFSKKESVDFITNSSTEQKDGSTCGIFALNNTKLILDFLDAGPEDLIKDFREFDGFTTQEDANFLRKTVFPELFVKGKYSELMEEKINKQILSLIRNHHSTSVEDLNYIISDFLGREVETEFEISAFDRASGSYKFHIRIQGVVLDELSEEQKLDLQDDYILGSASRELRLYAKDAGNFQDFITEEDLILEEASLPSLRDIFGVVGIGLKSGDEYKEDIERILAEKPLGESVESEILALSENEEITLAKRLVSEKNILRAFAELAKVNIYLFGEEDDPEIIIYSGAESAESVPSIFLAYSAFSSNPLRCYYSVEISRKSEEYINNVSSYLRTASSNIASFISGICDYPDEILHIYNNSKDLIYKNFVQKIREETYRDYADFERNIAERFSDLKAILQSPVFIIDAALDYESKKEYDSAISMFDFAIDTDSTYTAPAYYYKAYIKILKSGEDAAAESYELLLRAEDIINNILKDNIEIIELTSNPKEDSELLQQSTQKREILNSLIKSIGNAKNIIENLTEKHHLVLGSFDKIFNIVEKDDDGDFPEEILDIANTGFTKTYSLELIKKPTDWLAAACAFLVSAIEIAFGVFQMMAGNFVLASSLIMMGVKDMYTFHQIASGEQISLHDFFSQKVLEFGVTVISMGISHAFGIASSLSSAVAPATIFEGVKQVAKHMVLQYVVSTAIEMTSEAISEEILSDYEEKIKEKLQSSLACLTEDKELFDKLRHILSQDALFPSKIRFADKLMSVLSNLFKSKQNIFVSSFARILDDMSSGGSLPVHKFIKATSTLIKIGTIAECYQRIQDTLDEISEKMISFIESEYSKSASLEEILQFKLQAILSKSASGASAAAASSGGMDIGLLIKTLEDAGIIEGNWVIAKDVTAEVKKLDLKSFRGKKLFISKVLGAIKLSQEESRALLKVESIRESVKGVASDYMYNKMHMEVCKSGASLGINLAKDFVMEKQRESQERRREELERIAEESRIAEAESRKIMEEGSLQVHVQESAASEASAAGVPRGKSTPKASSSKPLSPKAASASAWGDAQEEVDAEILSVSAQKTIIEVQDDLESNIQRFKTHVTQRYSLLEKYQKYIRKSEAVDLTISERAYYVAKAESMKQTIMREDTGSFVTNFLTTMISDHRSTEKVGRLLKAGIESSSDEIFFKTAMLRMNIAGYSKYLYTEYGVDRALDFAKKFGRSVHGLSLAIFGEKNTEMIFGAPSQCIIWTHEKSGEVADYLDLGVGERYMGRLAMEYALANGVGKLAEEGVVALGRLRTIAGDYAFAGERAAILGIPEIVEGASLSSRAVGHSYRQYIDEVRRFTSDMTLDIPDSAIKGVFGEKMPHLAFSAMKGYVRYDVKLPGNKGIDYVYVKYAKPGQVDHIILGESKFQIDGGFPKLAKAKGEIYQLSPAWADKQIANLRTIHEDVFKILYENRDKILFKANVVDAKGRVRYFDYGEYEATSRRKPIRTKKGD